jgi:hypothetical protein
MIFQKQNIMLRNCFVRTYIERGVVRAQGIFFHENNCPLSIKPLVGTQLSLKVKN